MKQLKRYILRKFVYATSAREAIKKEKEFEVEDVQLDFEYSKEIEGFNKQ